MAKKRKAAARAGVKIKAISVTEQRRTANNLKKKTYEKLRRRYPEVNGKKVDWIEHSYDEGYIDFSVVFTDGTAFSVSYSLRAVLDAAQFLDMSSGDNVVLRTYYPRPQKK